MSRPHKGLPALFVALAAFSALARAELSNLPEVAEARSLLEAGAYVDAARSARESLAAVERRYGADSLAVAATLDLLSESLWRSGKARDTEARASAERAVAIKTQRLGARDPQVAASLRNLAIVLEDSGQREAARAEYERCVAILEEALGAEHERVAGALRDLGNLLVVDGQYAEAKAVYLRAVAIQAARLGPRHLELALTLNNLGNVLRRSGEYDAARTHYERALAIREEALGPNDPNVAWTLNALAVVHQETGDYDRARELYERVLAIRTRTLPPEHPHVSWSLNNLANVSFVIGDYRRARELYDRALEVQVRTLDPHDGALATTRKNLADLLFAMGDGAAARAEYDEALRAWRSSATRTGIADVLIKLAELELRRLDLAASRRHAAEALGIYADTLGADHLETLHARVHLARLSQVSGNLEAAGRELHRALLDLERVAPAHPLLARALLYQGELQLSTGRIPEATQSFDRALALREAALGSDHPLVGETLNGLARCAAARGARASALDHALRAERIGREHLRLTARALPERQALSYASVRSSGLGFALSLLSSDAPSTDVARVWEETIRSRAVVLDEMAGRRRRSRLDPDSRHALAWDRVAETSRQLANLVVRGAEGRDPAHYRRTLEAARKAKDDAERVLAAALAETGAPASPPSFAQIRAALPPRTALVAFWLDHPQATATGSNPDSARYVAFVLSDAAPGPVFVPLAVAGRIDRLVADWSRAIRDSTLFAAARRNDEPAYREIAGQLRSEIWDPLASRLGEARRVLIVLDGALLGVTIAALPIGAESYLVEQQATIHYLSAERDLVRAPPGGDRGDRLVLLGGPAYDAATRPDATAGSTLPASYRSVPPRCESFRAMRFEPLPGTIAEVEAIGAMWTRSARGAAVRRIGAEASEPAFKRLAPGNRVVHLATHGFFLGTSCAPGGGVAGRGIGSLVPAVGDSPGEETDGPLLLSGLALAGANVRHRANPEEDDGILTADEVAATNLTGVEWAVLSACDTGAGEVRAGEGVLGLQRAFQVAGAGTVIMSLWAVEDESARSWMTELYAGRLERGLDTAESVRTASLRALERSRAERGTAHPFHWAGFVAVGDWR